LFVCVEETANKQVQIVSLGAGFDTLYFWTKDQIMGRSLSKNLLFVEIDFKEVMQRKINLATTAKFLPENSSKVNKSGILHR